MKTRDLDQCQRYAPRAITNWTNTREDEQYCTADLFNDEKTQNCPYNNFIFRDDEVTISNDVSIELLRRQMHRRELIILV